MIIKKSLIALIFKGETLIMKKSRQEKIQSNAANVSRFLKRIGGIVFNMDINTSAYGHTFTKDKANTMSLSFCKDNLRTSVHLKDSVLKVDQEPIEKNDN